jgi:hypothetical protein
LTSTTFGTEYAVAGYLLKTRAALQTNPLVEGLGWFKIKPCYFFQTNVADETLVDFSTITSKHFLNYCPTGSRTITNSGNMRGINWQFSSMLKLMLY